MKNGILRMLPVLLCLLLCACGAPAQMTADDAQSAPASEALPLETPAPEMLQFPDGSVHRSDEMRLDLSALRPEDAEEAAALLRKMPALAYVDLGEESDGRGFAWAAYDTLRSACPQAQVAYRFTIFGQSVSTLDEALDLNHIAMDDEGEAVRQALRRMENCRAVDMDFCGVSDEAMAAIRDEHPEMEVVWRVWFGQSCSVRTDVERIVASNPDLLRNNNVAALRYCTKVRLLDIGHNETLSDFSFLAYMPDLEVAILGISKLNDLTPLAGCSKLEYLEINSAIHGMDLTPLGGLQALRHLNICYLGDVQGWQALEKLTGLERLWIGRFTYLPEGGLEELQAALPNTEINTTEWTGCGGTWREEPGVGRVPRYELLRQQFDYDHFNEVCAYYWNDPKYEAGG